MKTWRNVQVQPSTDFNMAFKNYEKELNDRLRSLVSNIENISLDIFGAGYTANRLVRTSATEKLTSVVNLTDWIYGTTNEVDVVAYTSAGTAQISLPEQINIGSIQFDITPSTAPLSEGQVRWNEDDKTLDIKTETDVTLQVGQESLVRVVNKTTQDILNGSLVYIDGAQGQRPKIDLAQADTYEHASNVVGMVTADIPKNNNGYVTTLGIVRDLDTSAFTEGDKLFLSSTTPGGFVNVEPQTPNYSLPIGYVITSSTAGKAFVKINGAHISAAQVADALSFNLVGSNISRDSTDSTLNFSTACALADYAYKNILVNNERTLGAYIYPYIHIFQPSSHVPNMLLQYRYQVDGVAKTTGWTNLKCNTVKTTYVSGTLHQVLKSTGISVSTNYGQDDVIQFRVLRDTTNASGVFSATDPSTYTIGIISFSVHI